MDFTDLPGWDAADHGAALEIFIATLDDVRPAPGVTDDDWAVVRSGLANSRGTTPTRLLESLFAPVMATDDAPALFTAYYEPELFGARAPDAVHRHPIHRPPCGSAGALPPSRAAIASGALDGARLELFWLADEIEAYFLHVQGSGRIRLVCGGVVRVGFAGRNGHPYRSIGAALVRRGALTPDEVDAAAIRRWLRAHSDKARDVMNENPSYIFFEEKPGLAPEDGPAGALGAPLSAGVSLAVDRSIHPLGAPIWIEAAAGGFGGRLMVAQDAGAAIRGAQRADLFLGAGEEAGARAGAFRATGRLVTLLPRAAAERIAGR